MAAQNVAPSEHIISVKTNLLVFAGLIALLIATVVAGQFDLGVLSIVIAMTIAAVKALLIILYFMHVRFSSRLAWVFAASGFVWLAILLSFVLSDYISRGWFGLPPPPLGGAFTSP
jgi:cytochrome c oxidase subunit 4